MLSKLAQFTDIRLALVVGGLSLQSQASALRSNPEIVVATPVRHYWQCLMHPLSWADTTTMPCIQAAASNLRSEQPVLPVPGRDCQSKV